MIRAFLVEDEAPARDRIKWLLAEEPDVQLVGEATNGSEALQMLRRLDPDLLFLDVQMPDYDGLQLLAALEDDVPEFVIFVTAYDQYALQAFEHEAVDYLLKPFDPDRFKDAVERVRKHFIRRAASTSNETIAILAAQVRAAQPAYIDRIAVKSGDRIMLIRVAEIDRVEAQRNYVVLHAKSGRYILRERISSFELKLDPATFARIHRSTIVNLDRIRELRPLFHGECAVVLQDGTQLTLSRRYRERLQQRWGPAL